MTPNLKMNKLSVAVTLALVSISTIVSADYDADDGANTTVNNTSNTSSSVVLGDGSGYTGSGAIDNNASTLTGGYNSYTIILNNYFNDVESWTPSQDTETSQSGNSITNSATVTVTGNNGIGINLESEHTQTVNAYASILRTGAGDVGDASATATADATANARVGEITAGYANTIINSGTLNISGDSSIGISLYADAEANALADARVVVVANADNDGGGYPIGTYTATATPSAEAVASVNNNEIQNSGVVNATGAGGYGIRLKAYSDTSLSINAVSLDYRVSGGVADPYGNYGESNNNVRDIETYISQVFSEVSNNDLTNSGTVTVGDGGGIVLDAVAVGIASSAYRSSEGYANSEVKNNTFTNSGIISADYNGSGDNLSDGIGLYATTSGVANSTTFDATIDGNTITNTNLIYGMRDGIRVQASSSDPSTNAAQITSNTINNNYVGWDDDAHTEEGRIVSYKRGIYLDASTVDSNTINNSSLIVSDPGMSLDGSALTKSDPANFDNTNTNFVAIELDGQGDNGNTLNLNNPAYLAGTILLSEGSGVNSNTTVNLTSGYSHSNVWSIQNDGTYGPATVNLLGQLPWFVRDSAVGVNGDTNNTYATYDPSMLAARANAAADLSEAANVAIATNMTRDLKAPSQLWMTGSYGNNRYDQRESNPNMDQKTRLYTVAVGYDQTVDNYRVGVMAGYNQSRLTTGSLYSDLYAHSYDNESSGGFASLYGMRDLGMFKLDLGLSAGAQEHDDKRFVNDNLEWWGISYAKSNYNSQWVSPSAKLALPFDLGSDWTVAPNAQVSYTYQRIGSYTEKESNSNASFDSYGIGVVESRLAVDLSKDVGGLKATLTGGYMNRDVKSGNSIDMTMIGHKQQVDSWTQNLDAVFARLSLKYDITDKFAINAMGSYMKAKHQGSDDGTSGGYGNLSLIYKF